MHSPAPRSSSAPAPAPAASTNGAINCASGWRALQQTQTQPDLSRFSPNVLAAAIKKYLRDLPNPLLPTELYDQFVAATRVPAALLYLIHLLHLLNLLYLLYYEYVHCTV